MYEILSNLPESVAYTCINCTEQHPPEWRLALEKELQLSLKQVLTALLNSRTTSHLLRYRQVHLPFSFPKLINQLFVCLSKSIYEMLVIVNAEFLGKTAELANHH